MTGAEKSHEMKRILDEAVLVAIPFVFFAGMLYGSATVVLLAQNHLLGYGLPALEVASVTASAWPLVLGGAAVLTAIYELQERYEPGGESDAA